MTTLRQNLELKSAVAGTVSTSIQEDIDLANQQELFCSQDWYQGVLQHHISRLTINPKDCYLDVGSGTGCGTKLLAEYLTTGGKVIGIEPSERMVMCAARNASGGELVEYRLGRAEDLIAVRGDLWVDGVVSFNTVHLLSSRKEFYQSVASVLPEGGTFSFCSGHHRQSMSEADRKNLQNMLLAAVGAGLTIARKLGPHSLKPDARAADRPQILDLSSTASELKQAGFKSIAMDLQPVTVPASSFAEFLTLPGSRLLPAVIPLEHQRQILLEALRDEGIESVSRTWLHVYAHR